MSLLKNLRLDVSKCKVLTYCRTSRKLQYDYTLNGTSMEVVNNFKDLGVIFESNFELKLHLETIVCQSL